MTQPAPLDNAALLRRALDQIDHLVDAIPPEAPHAPTPCSEFDVSGLLDHLAVIADRVTTAAGGAAVAEPTTPPASAARPEAVARWRAALDGLVPAMASGDPASVVKVPFGRMPLAAAYGVFVGEFTTHGWDLAVAIGRQDLLDEDLGRAAFAMVTARIPSGPREHTPFADVVPVPSDAATYDRLAGWMGRDPASWASK
ncbi:TIGR03086 family protein [Mycobacterium tuberculosis]|nr:TIGR03086 family protein [Mycobacterium tuberculosis]